jgi:5-methylcytosine-specific restriction endonuclease McrA
MSKKVTKAQKFVGMTLAKGDIRSVISLIEMTAGRFGLHKKFFKTELQFWDTIHFITGMRKNDGEIFVSAIHRIQGTIGAKSQESRAAMISKVDSKAFFEACAVPISETVTYEQILANAAKYGRPTPPKPRRVKAKTFSKPTAGTKEEFYKSWDWRTLRLEAIKEHGRACQCCGNAPGMKYASGEPVRICVDHIKPISKYWNLRLERTNLQILCDECNMGKGNWDETDFRPYSAPDEWLLEGEGVSEAILAQLTDPTTGRLQ